MDIVIHYLEYFYSLLQIIVKVAIGVLPLSLKALE